MISGGRIRAHASRIGAGVAIADALVVLGGDERDDAFAVTEDEERELIAFEKFFEDDARAGFAYHFAAEHFCGGDGGFIFGFGDDYAFAGCESIGFYDDGNVKM